MCKIFLRVSFVNLIYFHMSNKMLFLKIEQFLNTRHTFKKYLNKTNNKALFTSFLVHLSDRAISCWGLCCYNSVYSKDLPISFAINENTLSGLIQFYLG